MTGSTNARLHLAWQVGMTATIFTGLFHLINLVGPSRSAFGPAMFTPFRLAFVTTCVLLGAGFLAERRIPKPDREDLAIVALALLFVGRGIFAPETITYSINWVITGVGIFFLVKHGVRGAADVRLIASACALTVVAAGLFAVAEYIFKYNPLFESIQVDVIGMDQRVSASSQLYRVRSVIGHPGFVGAIMAGGAPLVMLTLWHRRKLLAGSLLILAAALFFSYSRGSWLLAGVFLLPLLLYKGRRWLRRNLRWVAPLVLVPALLLGADYLRREEVSATFGHEPAEKGLAWTKGNDGEYYLVSGQADGAAPYNKFFYFDVDDAFFREGSGAATVIVHFFDRGTGAIHVEYDSWDPDGGKEEGAYKTSGYVNKNNTLNWSTAAFYLEDPRFAGRENSGADFRVVDDDNLIVIDKVVLQKGRLKLLSVIGQQWYSRAGSLDTRLDLYPLAWSVVREHPLGVGAYNSPGTNHHAVDSWPLTWLMEFGWPGALLFLGAMSLLVREGISAYKARRGPAVVLLLSLVLLLLHGGHLMIVYDKPSLVLLGTVAGLYSLVRPWRRGGPLLDVRQRDCML